MNVEGKAREARRKVEERGSQLLRACLAAESRTFPPKGRPILLGVPLRFVHVRHDYLNLSKSTPEPTTFPITSACPCGVHPYWLLKTVEQADDRSAGPIVYCTSRRRSSALRSSNRGFARRRTGMSGVRLQRNHRPLGVR